MDNEYSFSVATLEIIIALAAAFIAGMLLCGILRLIGRLFRGKPNDYAYADTSAQQAQPPRQVHLDRSAQQPQPPQPQAQPRRSTQPQADSRQGNGNQRQQNDGFQSAFPAPRHNANIAERPPAPAPEPTPVNRLVEGGGAYEANIDTLLRRGSSSSAEAPAARPQNDYSNDNSNSNSFASRAQESLSQSTAPAATYREPTQPDEHVDDLKKLEGIGPNIERLLNQSGIFSYDRLATLSRDQLRDVLTAGGNEFKMHDPKSWPYQAELASKQNWDRLKDYQEFLIEGRR